MSFTRKIFDGARTGLNSLLEKVATDDTPLSYVDGVELDEELHARLEVRKASTTKPSANPRAKYAGASAAAQTHRDAHAAKRGARVHARQSRQRKAQQKATDDAYRQAREAERRRTARAAGAGAAGGSSRAGSQRRRGPRKSGGSPNIGDHLKTLNLPPTASLTEAKRAFRKLMRKYHPDMAPANKKKAATELTMRITAAYASIEEHFSGK